MEFLKWGKNFGFHCSFIEDNVLDHNSGKIFLFGGRTGIGKSILLMLMGIRSENKGKKVLFCCNEMTREMLRTSYFCLSNGVDFEKFNKGNLETHEKELYFKFLETTSDNFIIFNNNFLFSFNDFYNEAKKIKPDIIFIDGVHLFKYKEQKDQDRAWPIIAEEINSLARELDIPIVISMHLNRNATDISIDKMNSSHFALSDAFVWNAHSAFVIDKHEKIPKALNIKPVKLRESDDYSKVVINWNFQTGNFRELKDEKHDDAELKDFDF